MSKAKTVDLTSGPILKTLAELALPIMISSMLGTAYSIMDMAWIGLLGAKAVAGVGVGGMYVWLSQGLASLSRMGGQVNTAQACGRKDYDQARSYAAGSLQLTALSGILFAAVCVIFIQPLLGFFNLTDAETYTAARSYTLITCGLILFSYLNLTLTGLSTAQGDSRTPLLANFIGLAGNMILDPLLILGIGPFPRLEVAGAAIATVSSQILVFVVMVLRIRHSRLEPNVLQHLNLLSVFPKEYYKHIFRIGFPTAIQGSIYCFISMILTRMVSGYGAAAIATQRVGGQIESVSWNTADGFASALNAFIAQNYGARKKDRIRKGYSLSFRVLTIWGLSVIHAVTASFVLKASSLFRQKILKSSAYLTIYISFNPVFLILRNALLRSKVIEFLIFLSYPYSFTRGWFCHWLSTQLSSSFSTIFASSGEMIPPCGVPLSGMRVVLSGILIGAFRIRLIIKINCLSCIPIAHICRISLL